MRTEVRAGRGIVVTIMSNLERGEYFDAVGNPILSLNRYDFVIELGYKLANTNYMLEKQAEIFDEEYQLCSVSSSE